MSNKILLCISNTGGGHRSAANAIQSAIDELPLPNNFAGSAVEVVITDVVENSNCLHWVFVAIYNYLLCHQQSWMKYYYKFVEFVKPNNSALGYWLAAPYLRTLLLSINPLVVVSLHPMANHYLARMLKELKLPQKPKLIVVMTDPNVHFWSGWACHDADLIIAPNDLVRQRLLSLGIDSARISTIGMPVEPQFLRSPLEDRESLLRRLGLNPELATICLTAGWAGGGNMAKIYAALTKVKNAVQIIAICGNNKKLCADIQDQSLNSNLPTVVIPSVESLSDLMSACDLLITKAGGLTTFEAVARRLPMSIDMLTEPMPQESGTAEMLIEAGLAKPIKKLSDIVAIVESLERVDSKDNKPLPITYNLNRTDSVYEISRIILANCHGEHVRHIPIGT